MVIVEPGHFDIFEEEKWYFLLVSKGFVIILSPISRYDGEASDIYFIRIKQTAAGCMVKKKTRPDSAQPTSKWESHV
jgi:hypothetical protein